MAKSKVSRHPHTQELFVQSCEKWQRAKEQHRKASDALWFGILRLQFQDSELAMLREAGFLSERDALLLKVSATNTKF